MSKSALVMNTPENCYDCPFRTAYCGELEYEGLCELADCLDYDEILITEEHYDCENKLKPVWCPLKLLPEKKSTTAPVSNYEVQKNLFADGWNACLREKLQKQAMKMSDKKQAIRGEVDGEINRKRKKC